MTCCSSEEIIPVEDKKPNPPPDNEYAEEYNYNYNLPRCDSELTKIALEDYNQT